MVPVPLSLARISERNAGLAGLEPTVGGAIHLCALQGNQCRSSRLPTVASKDARQ
jgi:hypothetical protein